VNENQYALSVMFSMLELSFVSIFYFFGEFLALLDRIRLVNGARDRTATPSPAPPQGDEILGLACLLRPKTHAMTRAQSKRVFAIEIKGCEKYGRTC
jgi:hypothetical protein